MKRVEKYSVILMRGLFVAMALGVFVAAGVRAETPYRSPGTLQPYSVRREPGPFPSPTIRVSVEPATIERGQTAQLRWVVLNASRVYLNNEEITPFGDLPVSPSQTTDYVIEAVGVAGRESRKVTLTVSNPPSAPRVEFMVAPERITAGETVLLSWAVRDAVSVELDGLKIDATGQWILRPEMSHRYELLARGDRSAVRSAVSVLVLAPYPPPPPSPAISLPIAVHFEYDESVLLDADLDALAQVAALLKTDPTQRIRITGHTDAMGGVQYNMELGQRRADAVRDYLAAQHGVGPAQIETVSRGEAEPVAANTIAGGRDNPQGRSLNRRAEISFVR